ncbi:c-type cytochrome [Cupriavidus sp. SZY C1]|uniref:c-type cytochrome n=1 Tax=Cupriavidus sp. SZY C1 TaxID=3055037 RepID=UPI0028BBC387|nr:c-type cytochrome [Cupriavidus sp. SZY C1]MDT6964704.1 c-type cytochrome [Cupriavidus sp. SZY C1]
MTRSHWKLPVAVLAWLGVAAAAQAAAGVEGGKPVQKPADKLAAILPMCATCHGVDGISSVGLYPNLAGQKAEYLAKQLRDFKAGRRDDAVMRPMAEPLDDAAIDALSRHFGAMRAAP